LKPASVAVIETISNAVPAVCAVTVPELPDPDVNASPGSLTTSFATVPAENTMLPLVTAVKPVIPAVAVAVNVIVSDLE
jgi:hypothetical protein